MRVRAGNRYVERPVRELLVEALGLPLLVLAALSALRGGWGH